tara:strand:+ start:1204 stop:4140 length:2937 start_codon:yes stop_codon:yes gene_type:complete
MIESSNAFRRHLNVHLAIIIAALMFAPSMSLMVTSQELKDDFKAEASGDLDLKLYTLYLAEANSSAGGDGYITTSVPESGGQVTESALDETLEFSTGELMSSLQIFGRPKHGSSSGQYYIPVNLFVRAQGPSNSQVTWDISVSVDSDVKGSVSWETEACEPGLTNSCNFDHELFEIILDDDEESFVVMKDKELILEITAEMSGCESGGSPFGGSCEAEVAWNEIDGESNRYSQLEIESNAISYSEVVLQREGSEMSDGVELEWYPNDILSERTMQFSFDVKSAFGRYDMDSIRLLMRDPDGIYRIDHEISEDDDGIRDTSQGIFGTYTWIYPSGLPSGEYTVELEITDVQGNAFIVEHEPVEMKQWGVAINHREDRTVEYVAPGETTPVPLQLVHRGDSTKSMSVELELLTDLGSSWLVEFDSPGGYTLNSGGDILNPILTITSPDDLTGTPDRLEIRAVAEASIEGVETVVHQDVLTLDLEKLEVYQPPDVSIWNEDHDIPIANSSRPGDIDPTIPRYVEDNQFNTFLLEIFNTGFDTDDFRVDILQRAKSIIQIYDNDTGERILEDDGDGTFHIPPLERHSTQILRFNIKPSSDREDPDIGMVELEVISSGNASLRTTVSFTIQRTFGIRAEVSQDCDGTPLGHILVSLCSSSDIPEVNLRARITNSMTSSESASSWRIINPASLAENTDRNQAYGQWTYRILDENGSSVPTVSLGPGDFTEVFVRVTLTNQVIVGNHTVYLRIIEDVDDNEPRYFDLPMVFEVDADEPDLEIVQVTSNRELAPGEVYDFQLKVRNKGNSPLIVLLDAEVDNSGWSVDIGGPSGSRLLELEPFEEVTFMLEVTVPESANNGEQARVSVTAEPHDTEQSWPDSYTAETTVLMVVGINSVIELLINEVTHPRLSTVVIAVIGTLLIFGGIQSRMNRRKWAAHIAYLEAINSDEEIEEEDDSVDEILESVAIEEEVDDMVYDDDDIELV